jgi:hypothetical protein
MYQGGHRPPSRDGASYRDRARDRRSRSPHVRRSDRDGDYRRSRKGITAHAMDLRDGVL